MNPAKGVTPDQTGVTTLSGVTNLQFDDRTALSPSALDPIGVAIADQLSVVYFGRGISYDWRNATAAAVSKGPSPDLLKAFYGAAVTDRAFAAGDSLQSITNKTFLNIFGVEASPFEQNAWAGAVSAGYVAREALPWAMFTSYLAANNVPASYKLPAQSRIIAVNAFTNEVNGPQEATLGGAGAATAEAARAWLLPIRGQADAAAKILSASASVASISGAPAPPPAPSGGGLEHSDLLGGNTALDLVGVQNVLHAATLF